MFDIISLTLANKLYFNCKSNIKNMVFQKIIIFIFQKVLCGLVEFHSKCGILHSHDVRCFICLEIFGYCIEFSPISYFQVSFQSPYQFDILIKQS